MNINAPSTNQDVKRIGILLSDLGKLNTSVLKFLVLQINTQQQAFEFEFLPVEIGDEFLRKLSDSVLVNREAIRAASPSFLDRYQHTLREEITDYHIQDIELPNYFILITMARFNDNYYSLRQGELSILALGNWERWMAPPSIIECILTLVLREALSVVCPALRGSIHLGTRGCICDFTSSLGDTRIKVLSGFICHSCSTKLDAQGLHSLSKKLVPILSKEWFGNTNTPGTPASIVSNLGFNLFTTRGVEPSLQERILNWLKQEGSKQIISIIGAIIQFILIALVTFFLVRLGLK